MFTARAPYIIAEAGVNHDGSEEKARRLVDIAADAGAEAVKFQMFSPEALVTARAPTAAYQAANLKDNRVSQLHMLEKLALPRAAYVRLYHYCRERGIDFLCTPFDHGSLEFLVGNTHMRYLKLGSGEVTHGPLLLAAARTGLPVILSTGMADLAEIGAALAILHFGYTHPAGHPKVLALPVPSTLAELKDKVTLLHCVSQYPAPARSTNLRAMDTLKEVFGLPVGFSDHSEGYAITLAAAARGAAMIEKHFTYDPAAGGPDHAASLSPEGLKAMVAAIRKKTPAALDDEWLGSGEKTCQPEEQNTRAVARRSVIAARRIAKGEVFTAGALACKRPATGALPPNRLWELLGKTAKRDYAADDFIHADEIT